MGSLSVIQPALGAFVASLNDGLEPVRVMVSGLDAGGVVETGNAFRLSHQPRLGPEAYAVTLYKPLTFEEISRYQALNEITIDEPYLGLLAKLNGIRAFEFSLFGAPRSMAYDPQVLDRASSQPLDLATANKHWKFAYKIPGEWLHIGSAPLSPDENVGYFLGAEGGIHASRKCGEILRSWVSLADFLCAELAQAEQQYPAYLAYIAASSQSNSAVRRWLSRLFRR